MSMTTAQQLKEARDLIDECNADIEQLEAELKQKDTQINALINVINNGDKIQIQTAIDIIRMTQSN